MANAGTVNINLVAQTAAFMDGMKRAAGSVASLESMVSRAQMLVGGFLGVQALRSVVSWTSGIMQSMDATAKFADRIGTTTEFLTTMQHAAELSGVANETLNNGLQKMVKNVSEAAAGNKALGESFGELRLSAQQLSGLAPEEQFLAIADAMNKVQNSGDRVRIAMDVFGKTGAELLPVLDLGTSGLALMREEADALGLTFSRMDAAKVEAANDAMSRVGAVATGIGRSIATEVSPVVLALANDFVKNANAMGGWKSIVVGALESVVRGIGYIATAWDMAKAGWSFAMFAGNNIATSFLKGADGVVRAVQWIAGVWDNFGLLIQNTNGLILATVSAGWQKMKEPVAAFVQYVITQLSDMLLASSQALIQIDATAGAALMGSALEMRASVGALAADAEKSANDASAAMAQAAQNVKASWSGLLTVNTGGSAALQGMIDEYEVAGAELAATFWGQFNAVTNEESMTGIMAWFERAVVEGAKMAELTAAQTKERSDALKAARVQELADYEEFDNWLTQVSNDGASKRLAWEKKTQADKLAFTAGVLGNLATLQNTHSKKAFAIGKAAAMAQAVVSTAAGIARAFGELPFWVAIPAAAAIAVAGAVQISTIASTSFGGGGSVSSAGGSIALANGEPSGISSAAQPGVSGNRQNTLAINFTGLSDNQILNGQQVRTLIDQINEAQADGSTVVNVRAA